MIGQFLHIWNAVVLGNESANYSTHRKEENVAEETHGRGASALGVREMTILHRVGRIAWAN